MKPGEIISRNKEIVLNEGRDTVKIVVSNMSDRPVQIGSHFHFFEVNKALSFDRKISYGKRLNIPSGTSVRFEPGEEKTVELVEVKGAKRFIGLNGLVNGQANDENLEKSLLNAKLKNFI